MSKEKLLEGSFYTMLYKMICPYCGTYCLVNDGDPSDICKMDIESVTCHNCKKVFLMPGVKESHHYTSDHELETEDDLEMDPYDSEPVS